MTETAGKLGAAMVAWRWVDTRLRNLSRTLQRLLRLVRLAFALLIVGILVVVASAVVGLLWPQHFAYAYAAAVLFLIVPLVLLAFLVSVPLRWKSVVRLIERGYPANRKEIGLRAAAMKWRDQSVETEELLLETAMNEWRKFLRHRAAARAQAQQPAGQDPPAPPPASAPPPDGPAPHTPPPPPPEPARP